MDDARSFINKEIADYENRLKQADRRRQDFRTENLDILSKPNGGNRIDVATAAYDQATRDYNAALARHNSVKVQLESTPKTIPADGRMFQNGSGSPGTTSASAQRTANYLQRLQQAEASLDDLRTKYTDNHPEVIATKKLISQLQAELSAAPKADDPNAATVMIPNPILVQLQAKYSDEEANLAVQRQRLDAAARDLDSAKREATRAIDTQTRFNELDRDYGNIEATYKQLLQSRETAALSQARDDQNEGISFRVLDPPQTPRFPNSPNRRALNTMVLLMGLGSGAAVAVLLMLNASRLITVEDIATLFAVPVLGVVTRIRDTTRTRLGWATLSTVVCAVLLLVAYGGVLAFLKTTVHSVSIGTIFASLKNSIHVVIGASSV